MLTAELFLIAMLATRPAAAKPTAPVRVEVREVVRPESEIADVIRMDFEAIAGQGSVDISSDNGRLISIRILVPTLSSEFCNPIYDHEIKLFRLFPDLNFDFYVRLREPR